ncbi:hypothetical protein FNV43_RR02544 [Rhamnella rubrinervis]|uniref:Uncharacterized protein n=1 Tax=Rhamnella rubrinervis TaxID=2594499 RepID=A0A8K0HSS2_9ROSA|nr:hypothetical protein FNV43_RR02544 [Rhamnella rubrinervis]
MREIIHAKDDDELQGSSSTSSGSLKNNNIAVHHLELLGLDGLTSLTCFHLGNYALVFPKLRHLTVGNCPEMRNFCAHVIVTAPKLHTFITTTRLTRRIPVTTTCLTRRIPEPELDSNDHAQVVCRVDDEDNNMNIEQLIEGGVDNGTVILLVFIFIIVQIERHHIACLSHRFRFSVSGDFSCFDAIRVGGFCDWVCVVAFGDGFGVGFNSIYHTLGAAFLVTWSVQVALEMVKDDLNIIDKAFGVVLGQRTIQRNQLLVSIAKSKLPRQHDGKNENATKPFVYTISYC